LEDRLKVGKFELTRESIPHILSENGGHEKTINELSSLISAVEMAQYAPTGGEVGMKENFDKTSIVLMQIQSELKK